MFLLAPGREPESLPDLRRLLAGGLAQVFGVKDGDTRIRVSGSWPSLESVEIDLTRIRLDPLNPPLVANPLPTGGGTAPLASHRLELRAKPLLLGETGQLDLAVTASCAELSFVRDNAQKLWLFPHHFASGEAKVSMTGGDLEHVFLDGARRAAAGHGVTIEEGRLQLKQSGGLEIQVEAELVARKLFVKSRILLLGRVGFDEQLSLRFSDLSCSGKGIVAALACKLIEPHLEAWEQRSLPLLSLAFPSVRLQHAVLTTDASGRLEAKATLGERPEESRAGSG